MMKNLVGRLVKEEEGQALTEYGLLVGLIALALVAVVTAFGGELRSIFNQLINQLPGAGTPVN